MTPYLEIGGDWREALPGIFLIELPLPFSLGLINVYLVRLEDGWMLVDTGMETEASLHALARAMEGAGVTWRDIRHILLTHMHPDHTGLTPRLLALTGARLHLHAADERLLAEVSDHERFLAWQAGVLARAGVPEDEIGVITASMAEVHRSFHPLRADGPLQGGEAFAAHGGTLEVVWTPGHSPGHVCVYHRERRALFSGDHMLEHISPNIGWHPDRDALGEFLESLDRIAAMEIDVVLPSHGSIFGGHREWVRRTREHHAERCRRVLDLLTAGPQTANELALRLWERDLSPFHYRFAIFELLAHLEYLRRRGEVRERGDAPAVWEK